MILRALAVALVSSTIASAAPPPGLVILDESAPVYLALRPGGVATLARRMKYDESPEIVRIKKEYGVDPLDAALLGTVGIDPNAAIVGELAEPGPGGAWFHHRLVARVSDAQRFSIFVGGLGALQDVPIVLVPAGTPLAQMGVRATSDLGGGGIAILRVAGDLAIVDLATPGNGVVPDARSLAERFPVSVKHRFVVNTRARRRLTDEEVAIALYVDGRRTPLLAGSLARAGSDLTDERSLAALEKRDGPRCRAQWSGVPASFDDVALSATLGDTDATWRLTWSGARPLQLKLPTVDDGGVSTSALGPFSAATLSLRLLSLTPFHHLRRSGPLKDFSSLVAALERCGGLGAVQIGIRHWPEAIGALLDVANQKGESAAGMLGPLLQATIGQLRNIDVLLRDQRGGSPRYAVAATFDHKAKAIFQMLLAAVGEPESAIYGQRSALIYDLSGGALGIDLGAAAVEDVADGRMLIVGADSRATVDWVYSASGLPHVKQLHPPVAIVQVSGARITQFGGLVGVDRKASALLDFLVRSGRVDGTLAGDRDAFELTVHASFN